MKFSDKVKYVRMKLELSWEWLAKGLGVSYSTISRWEHENRDPQMADAQNHVLHITFNLVFYSKNTLKHHYYVGGMR